jgi:hypothetical protein
MPAPAHRTGGDEAVSPHPLAPAVPAVRPELSPEQTRRILFDAACDCIAQAEQDLAAALGRGDQAAVMRLHDELALYDVLVTRFGEDLRDDAPQCNVA